MVHYRDHIRPPLDPVQMNLVLIATSCSLKIHFNTILPIGLGPQVPQFSSLLCRVCQFSTTLSRRLHNHNRFRPRLLFMLHPRQQCGSQWPHGQRVGLRPLACWDCCFESRRGHGCLSQEESYRVRCG